MSRARGGEKESKRGVRMRNSSGEYSNEFDKTCSEKLNWCMHVNARVYKINFDPLLKFILKHCAYTNLHEFEHAHHNWTDFKRCVCYRYAHHDNVLNPFVCGVWHTQPVYPLGAVLWNVEQHWRKTNWFRIGKCHFIRMVDWGIFESSKRDFVPRTVWHFRMQSSPFAKLFKNE